MLVAAHLGHWSVSMAYVAPIAVVAAGLWWQGRRMDGRREDDAPDGD